MKIVNRIQLIVAGLAVVLTLWAVQAEAVPISGLFNTGVITNGVLAPGGTADLHYTLTTSADPLFPGPVTFVTTTIPSPPWMANGPNSQWIAPRADASNGNAAGTYIYRTTFSLASLDPSSAVITGQWSTDNNGLDILINGTSTGQTTGFAGFDSFVPFSITSGFTHGLNTLDFALSNGGGPTGLRVEFFRGTANLLPPTGAIPEPATLMLLGSGLAAFAGARWFKRA